MNQIVILGRLGKDPKQAKSDKLMATFDVASNVAEGKVVWFHILVFDASAKIALRFLRKGSRVQVIGRVIPSDNGISVVAANLQVIDWPARNQDPNTESPEEASGVWWESEDTPY